MILLIEKDTGEVARSSRATEERAANESSRIYAIQTCSFNSEHECSIISRQWYYLLVLQEIWNLDLFFVDIDNENFEIRYQQDLETAIFRLVLLSYIPVGFWSRIITRLLADDAIVDILRSYFNLPVSVCLVKPTFSVPRFKY